MSSAAFDISDDCNGLRIGDKLYAWDSGTTAYVSVDLPINVTALTNTVFSEDFQVAVNNAGIYTYKVKSGS